VLSGFVTFEGIDGAGKTTVSRLVAESFRAAGVPVFLTTEPTATWLGDAVRRAYDDDVGPIAESFLFLADRAAHVDEIRAHLEKGELVLCDRYADSTYAYQGARLEGVVSDPVRFLQRASEAWIVPPDLTLLLRVPAELGLKRIQTRPNLIRFEDLAFLKKVAANYDRLARSRRFVVLDGARDAKAVAADAVAAIEKRIRRRQAVTGTSTVSRSPRWSSTRNALPNTIWREISPTAPAMVGLACSENDLNTALKNIRGDFRSAIRLCGQTYLSRRRVIAPRMGCTHGVRRSF